MDGESDELDALQQEFQWLLKEEVNDILSQLHDIIVVSGWDVSLVKALALVNCTITYVSI